MNLIKSILCRKFSNLEVCGNSKILLHEVAGIRPSTFNEIHQLALLLGSSGECELRILFYFS